MHPIMFCRYLIKTINKKVINYDFHEKIIIVQWNLNLALTFFGSEQNQNWTVLTTQRSNYLSRTYQLESF